MAYLGQMNSYENTVPDKRMVTDRILNINPLKIATYARLGADIGKFNFANAPSTKYEWLEDAYVAETLGNYTGLTASSATTTFTPTTTTLLQPGDLLRIEDEIIWVSAVNSSGIPTITRGYGTSTAATHADNTTCTRVGRARIDGDDADDSPMTEVSSSYNYTQIFQRSIDLARTRRKMSAYGISDPLEYEKDKKMDELMMQLCKLPYHGVLYVGTSALARTAAGFKGYITTNTTDVASAALTRDHIDDLLQDIHGYGGDPDVIFCGSFSQRKINSFYEGFVTTERSEQLGGNLIKKLQNPISGSILDVIVDLHCPTDEMWVIQSDQVGFFPFDPFFYEDLAKTGDATVGEIIGEYGFVVKAEKWHGYLDGISTSS